MALACHPTSPVPPSAQTTLNSNTCLHRRALNVMYIHKMLVIISLRTAHQKADSTGVPLVRNEGRLSASTTPQFLLVQHSQTVKRFIRAMGDQVARSVVIHE